MLPVLTAAQMRLADRHAIEVQGLPGATLMEHAGQAVWEVLRARFAGAPLAVLCGRGNNGGDGLAVARLALLGAEGPPPLVLLFGKASELGGDVREHLARYTAAHGRVREVCDEPAWEAQLPEVLARGVIVDALLGTGLEQAPRGTIARAIEDLLAAPSRPPVVAVDLPSGLPSDHGALAWPVLNAHLTVTFAALKHGLVLPPACEQAGQVLVADIGIERSFCIEQASSFLIEATDAAMAHPRRPADAHKGSFGHLLVLAGSVGQTGAAALCLHAAMRGGCGLVTVATPAEALPLLLAQARSEAMTAALPAGWDSNSIEDALALCEGRDAVVLGPGLGTSRQASQFVREFVERCPLPLVIDADGLNGMVGTQGWGAARAARVLTPHPGEMGRLQGSSSAEVQRERFQTARDFAQRSGAYVVLKGRRTLVAEPSGRVAINPTGNPGMATAGTGDVLAGLLGALLARGSDAWEAATAGAYLHGLAGDLAAHDVGQESLLAGDVVDYLPQALRDVAER